MSDGLDWVGKGSPRRDVVVSIKRTLKASGNVVRDRGGRRSLLSVTGYRYLQNPLRRP